MVIRPRLVMLGRQGAGKGTQAERLAGHYGLPRISTGDMFRAAVRAGTPHGELVHVYIAAGDLVPDDVVIGLVEDRLGQDDARDGFVLDGFPRTVEQATALDTSLGRHTLDLVIELTVPTEVVLRRLASRRVCSDCGRSYSNGDPPAVEGVCDTCGGKIVQRDDDTEEAIRRRLDLYAVQTEPLVAYYHAQGKLAPIDGTGGIEAVAARVLKSVEGRLGPRGG